MYEDLPTICYYKGRPLDEYSKEGLIQIAAEGWSAYHRQIQDSIRSMNLLNELPKAARR